MSSNYGEFLPYIAVDEGLARLMNNKKFYAKLLKSYLLSANYGNIEQLLYSNQTGAAREAIHAFKGISANLSITKNYTLSSALETLVKENQDYTAALAELNASVETTVEMINRLIPILEA